MTVKMEFEGETVEDIVKALADLGFVRPQKFEWRVEAFKDARAAASAESAKTEIDEHVENVKAFAAAPEAPKEPVKRTRKPKEEPKVEAPAPEPEQAATEAEQDAADEAAESAAARKDDALTLDDLRGAMGAYQNTYGAAAAGMDRPAIFAEALGAPPENAPKMPDGTPVWSIKMFIPDQPEFNPDVQDRLAKAVEAWRSAVANNPYGREKVA
jgi:hypothetical protein